MERRQFIQGLGSLGLFAALPSSLLGREKIQNAGLQLYTFRKEMLENPAKTLELISKLGIRQIESAGSTKGFYYGLKPKEMSSICRGLGMKLRSGHVNITSNWAQTIDDAAESGQEYLICSSLPSRGQTIDNYKKVADAFNKAGEECRKSNLKFGYHNHDYEFQEENGQILYDVLMDNTDPELVHMELDLGWVVASGKDPMYYFDKYTGRFPLWHLKDMDGKSRRSTEFGRGILNISKMLAYRKQSGLKYFFIEQEDYAVNPHDSMEHNMEYLKSLKT